jgi:hypothetical protein
MKTLSDKEKYFELYSTLECIIRALRTGYNSGMFEGPEKRYVFNLLREGDTVLKKVSE